MDNPFQQLSQQINQNFLTLYAKLDAFLEQQKGQEAELLTRTEYAKAVKITLPTLWRWENEGRVKPVIIGGKKFYRNPVKTVAK